jgi:hypothetical protein
MRRCSPHRRRRRQLLGEPGLADAGFSSAEHDARLAGHRRIQAVDEAAQLVPPADELAPHRASVESTDHHAQPG